VVSGYKWVKFVGDVLEEDGESITLSDPESGAILKVKSGGFRKDEKDGIQIKIGARPDFIKLPNRCRLPDK